MAKIWRYWRQPVVAHQFPANGCCIAQGNVLEQWIVQFWPILIGTSYLVGWMCHGLVHHILLAGCVMDWYIISCWLDVLWIGTSYLVGWMSHGLVHHILLAGCVMDWYIISCWLGVLWIGTSYLVGWICHGLEKLWRYCVSLVKPWIIDWRHGTPVRRKTNGSERCGFFFFVQFLVFPIRLILYLTVRWDLSRY